MERYARWLASKEEGAKHKLYTAIADNLATGKPAVAPNAPERPQGPDWPEMHRLPSARQVRRREIRTMSGRDDLTHAAVMPRVSGEGDASLTDAHKEPRNPNTFGAEKLVRTQIIDLIHDNLNSLMATKRRSVKSESAERTTDAHKRKKDFLSEAEIDKLLEGRQEGAARHPRSPDDAHDLPPWSPRKRSDYHAQGPARPSALASVD